jgi:hypothetical protein
VFFHDPATGWVRSLPTAWTDLAAPDPFVRLAAGRAILRFTDLQALARLLHDVEDMPRAVPQGGAIRVLVLPVPPPFAQSRLTPRDTLAKIDHLLDAYTDAEVADQLNVQGYRAFAGFPFQAPHVSQLRRKHGLKDRFTRLRQVGMRTAEELATHLGVTAQTIWRW